MPVFDRVLPSKRRNATAREALFLGAGWFIGPCYSSLPLSLDGAVLNEVAIVSSQLTPAWAMFLIPYHFPP